MRTDATGRMMRFPHFSFTNVCFSSFFLPKTHDMICLVAIRTHVNKRENLSYYTMKGQKWRRLHWRYYLLHSHGKLSENNRIRVRPSLAPRMERRPISDTARAQYRHSIGKYSRITLLKIVLIVDPCA